MSTVFSHAIVPVSLGLALGRNIISTRVLLVGILFAILPDLDVIGFAHGIAYHSPWGHRGFTHSIVFAICCGSLAVCCFKLPQNRSVPVFLFLSFSMISHALLDAMTFGGLGVGIGWPFTDQRFFFSWRPLPVSPIGIERFFNYWGMYVIKKEVVRIWLPLLGVFGFIWIARYAVKASRVRRYVRVWSRLTARRKPITIRPINR